MPVWGWSSLAECIVAAYRHGTILLDSDKYLFPKAPLHCLVLNLMQELKLCLSCSEPRELLSFVFQSVVIFDMDPIVITLMIC